MLPAGVVLLVVWLVYVGVALAIGDEQFGLTIVQAVFGLLTSLILIVTGYQYRKHRRRLRGATEAAGLGRLRHVHMSKSFRVHRAGFVHGTTGMRINAPSWPDLCVTCKDMRFCDSGSRVRARYSGIARRASVTSTSTRACMGCT